MIATLLEPLTYSYMVNAIWLSGLVGCVAGCFSAFIMLRGWALIGDALSHALVPGVAAAFMLGLPVSLGAFVAACLAAAAMLFIRNVTQLKEDTAIGVVFTTFFGLGLFMVSVSPLPIDITRIALGNILAIAPDDALQMVGISVVALAVIIVKWRDLMLIFFDESHAHLMGVKITALKIIFFALLAAVSVAALQTVGAFLVVAMVITPGATAYLLCTRFSSLLMASGVIGGASGAGGAYLSYFLDGATGGIIISLQAMAFLVVFIFTQKPSGRLIRREGRQND